ncbi:hypothetical protein PR202_gb07774 [Eleusine coracana subsp. coracana]|uniref:Uncharacterized protein n=1 Tax=Eleusine coracana subsp. coracana TaxID=191504 RepID=A0AAV5EAK9_ELECO|nr:hypothetical protein PR202_gb07774 [Eleusine coracana subsp. coracana]
MLETIGCHDHVKLLLSLDEFKAHMSLSLSIPYLSAATSSSALNTGDRATRTHRCTANISLDEEPDIGALPALQECAEVLRPVRRWRHEGGSGRSRDCDVGHAGGSEDDNVTPDREAIILEVLLLQVLQLDELMSLSLSIPYLLAATSRCCTVELAAS